MSDKEDEVNNLWKEGKIEKIVGIIETLPPQNSTKVVSHGSGEKEYFTLETKIYCDDDVERRRRIKDEFSWFKSNYNLETEG